MEAVAYFGDFKRIDLENIFKICSLENKGAEWAK